MTKRTVCLVLCLAAFLSALCGCAPQKKDNGFDIICTVFPIYDWVRECLGDIEGVSVSLLVDSGTDPHSYNATAEDIAVIASCDMLIYVGGESDGWVESALSNVAKNAPKGVRLFDLMEDRVHHGHDHGEVCEDTEHHSESAYDEHVWLSLKNASMLTERIAGMIAESLPEKAEAIKSNARAYTDTIKALDKELEDAVSLSERSTLLFADRFPFKYLTEDYGIDYFAAFSGCSADSEASFETVIRLTQKLNELDLPYVLVLEASDMRLADTVISGSEKKNAEILTLDSMQSISAGDITDKGISYIEIMKSNVSVLKKALG